MHTSDAEAFDIRIGKENGNGENVPEGDILFFRAGFYNYSRINRDQMAFRHTNDTEYRVNSYNI